MKGTRLKGSALIERRYNFGVVTLLRWQVENLRYAAPEIGALLAYNLAAAGEGELAGNDFAEDFASAQIDVATVG